MINSFKCVFTLVQSSHNSCFANHEQVVVNIVDEEVVIAVELKVIK